MIKKDTNLYLVAHTSSSLFGLSILKHEKKYTKEEFNELFEEALSECSIELIDEYVAQGFEGFVINFKDVYQAAMDYLIDEYGFSTIDYDNRLYFSSSDMIYSTDGSHKKVKTPDIIKNVTAIIEEEMGDNEDDIEDL